VSTADGPAAPPPPSRANADCRAPGGLIPVFDFDGTLLDSDEALLAPFVALGVPRDDVTFGHVVDVECARLGIDPADYLARYDPTIAVAYQGVDDVVRRLERWAVCSNKHPEAGRAELARLGWAPDVALFSDAFGGASKQLGPVLGALGVDAAGIVFVGDTEHDRACARSVGCRFALAGWNARAVPEPDDVVLDRPGDLLRLLDASG
jgi:phosphoglycolate phosphatase-like HAD superfamily hydrolase